MTTITAEMVSELRAKTDQPMMMCKKALTAADGDIEAAAEMLRAGRFQEGVLINRRPAQVMRILSELRFPTKAEFPNRLAVDNFLKTFQDQKWSRSISYPTGGTWPAVGTIEYDFELHLVQVTLVPN